MEIVVAAICLAIGIGIGRWTKRGSRTSAEETQRLQRAHGVNPLGALHPALIERDEILAVLQVVR